LEGKRREDIKGKTPGFSKNQVMRYLDFKRLVYFLDGAIGAGHDRHKKKKWGDNEKIRSF